LQLPAVRKIMTCKKQIAMTRMALNIFKNRLRELEAMVSILVDNSGENGSIFMKGALETDRDILDSIENYIDSIEKTIEEIK
jgi:uncharacterized protein YigA (DUF484 family)